jgi:hypothetical protein
MSLPDDSLFKRIQETVQRLTHAPTRALAPVLESQDKERNAVRQLGRSRMSQILRQLRATQGLSYGQIQQQTGLAQQLLFDVEYKERRLTLAELRLLAQCYNVSVNDLLGIDLDP